MKLYKYHSMKTKYSSRFLRLVSLLLVIASFLLSLSACANDKTEDEKENFDTQSVETSHEHAWDAWWETVKKATCTEDGIMQRKCSCGEIEERSIDKHGHAYVTGQIEKQPTCYEDGTEYSICNFCGNKTYRAIPASHIYISNDAKKVSCTQNGWEEYKTCKVCDYSSREEIPATGHSYEKGLCISCGDAFGHKTLQFTSNRNGTCYVSGIGSCTDANIIVPEKSPNGDWVTGIGENAFTGCVDLVSVTLPSRISQIHAKGFEGCDSLERVVISEDNNNFYISNNCIIEKNTKTLIYGLKNAVIPTDDSVTVIGAYAFAGQALSNELLIPNNIESIAEYAFRNCDTVVNINVGEKMLTIGKGAFYGCLHLEKITLPNSITKISDDAFFECVALKEVHIDDLANWCKIVFESADSNPIYFAHSLYVKGVLITDIEIPSNVDTVNAYVFFGCTALNSIVIPNNVTSIKNYAFSECGQLNNIAISNNSISVSSSAFIQTEILNASIPTNALSIITKSVIVTVVITGGNQIPDNAFYNCDALTSVEIAYGVTKIGKYAFYDCDALEYISIPYTVSKIGKSAFYSCDSMVFNEEGNAKFLYLLEQPFYWLVEVTDDDTVTEYVLPDGVIRIADGVFYDRIVTKVVIPESVVSIGEKVFDTRDTVEIEYLGTRTQWKQINIYKPDIYYEFSDYLIFEFQPVKCSDATIQPIRGYLGSQITGNAAYIYEKFKDIAIRTTPENTLSFELSQQITTSDFEEAWCAFKYDFPECFWFHGDGWSYGRHPSTSYYSSVTLKYGFSGSALDNARIELDNVVDSIIANMPNGSTWDKTLYLHDVVANKIVYYSNTYDQLAYGGLVKNRAVCAGYAASYSLLLYEAGIKASIVKGRAKGGAHAWNAVWLDDDTCVYTDITWNDWGADFDNEIGHYYFNISLTEMNKNHTPDYRSYWPTCNHTDQSFYDKNPNAFPIIDADSTIEYMASLFTGEGSQKRVLHCFMKVDPDSWWDENIREIYTLLGGTGSYRGSWYHYGSEAEIYLILKGTFE